MLDWSTIFLQSLLPGGFGSLYQGARQPTCVTIQFGYQRPV